MDKQILEALVCFKIHPLSLLYVYIPVYNSFICTCIRIIYIIFTTCKEGANREELNLHIRNSAEE